MSEFVHVCGQRFMHVDAHRMDVCVFLYMCGCLYEWVCMCWCAFVSFHEHPNYKLATFYLREKQLYKVIIMLQSYTLKQIPTLNGVCVSEHVHGNCKIIIEPCIN